MKSLQPKKMRQQMEVTAKGGDSKLFFKDHCKKIKQKMKVEAKPNLSAQS